MLSMDNFFVLATLLVLIFLFIHLFIFTFFIMHLFFLEGMQTSKYKKLRRNSTRMQKNSLDTNEI